LADKCGYVNCVFQAGDSGQKEEDCRTKSAAV